MEVTELLKFLGGATIALGAVAWLFRSLTTHLLGKDVEKFKSDLQSAAATELELLKHELRVVSATTEKQVGLLLEQRAAVIAELYRRLVEFLGAAESFVSYAEWSGEPSKPEKAVLLSEKAVEFRTYVLHHRIYFTEDLCEKFESLFDAAHGPALRYRIWLRAVEDGERVNQEYQKAWTAAWESIRTEVPPLEKAVREEFRALLGVGISKESEEKLEK